ncbi:MAG: hypothetical protein Aureis2KO_00220 [Aureisphaera sp.]
MEHLIYKKVILTSICLLCFGSAFSQITLIPDTNFEQFLIDSGIDTDGVVNGQVLTSDIEDELQLIFLGMPITDLTGIEDFTSLEVLKIEIMDIEELNISNNLNLRELNIEDVSLNSLDISNNINLEDFSLFLNSPLGTYTSTIDELDISANTLLEHFSLSLVDIQFLDASNNPNITFFELSQMESLVNLNLKSGNNTGLSWLQIILSPNLQCIQVDDPAAVIAGTDPPYDSWTIDNNPIITDDCSFGTQDYLANLIRLYPNPIKDNLNINNSGLLEINSISVHDLSGKLLLLQEGFTPSLSLAHLDTGILILKVATPYGTLIEKVIKE